MQFKAKILSAISVITEDAGPSRVTKDFSFTYRRILFDKRHDKRQYFLSIPLSCQFQHESEYTLATSYDKEGIKRFVITIGGDKNCSSYIEFSLWNRMKCNIVHKRYLPQRDSDWFYKTIIATAIGFLFGLIGVALGYSAGRQKTTIEEKSKTQDTIQKLR